MDVKARKYQTSTLVAVAGCKSVTFRAWRLRNELFPETKENRAWNYFSVVDICVVRAIVVMTEHGIPAADAIWHADHIQRLNFARMLEGHTATHLEGFFAGALNHTDDPEAWIEPRCTFIGMGPEDAVGPLLKRTKGVMTILDLQPIVEHVLAELAALQSETVATADETRRIVFGSLANALRPKPETEGGDT